MKSIYRILSVLLVAATLSSCSVLNVGSRKEPVVTVKTTEGIIKLKLYDETPIHRDNFVQLVKSRFYDGVLFHRVIDEFMIQGGDPDSKSADADTRLGSGDVGYTLPAEFRTPMIYHKKGALAAARQGDQVNPQKASSGCQFYIVVGKQYTDAQLDVMQRDKTARYGQVEDDPAFVFSQQAREDYKIFGGTPNLDGNYTVFGEVIKGIEIVEKISKTETNAADRPLNDVRILKMRITKRLIDFL